VGSSVLVRVERPASLARDFHLHRALVVLPSVAVTRVGDIAVFQILSFNQSTTERLAEALAETRRQSGGRLAGIVLDLRGNPGGLLDQAVSLSDLFIESGPIVRPWASSNKPSYFAASGRSVAPQVRSRADQWRLRLVLRDRRRRPQDSGRAVVIGSSSYGKGTVQTVLRLPNDGELTLTWAQLVTPAGYYLQTHGVVPMLCTSDLGDDDASMQRALQRAAALAQSSSAGLRSRSVLDERGWSDLRHSCPARQTSPAVDLKLAERVLADHRLYASAVHSLRGNTHLAHNPAPAGPPERALTDVDRALSSRQR
jgi:carboxyl-terminal processing protease